MHAMWLIRRVDDDRPIPELLTVRKTVYATLFTEESDAIRSAWLLSLWGGTEWVVVPLSVAVR